MRIRGAAEIGRRAADALASDVSRTRGALPSLRRRAEAGARTLLSARPTAVSLEHGVGAVLRAIAAAGDPNEARAGARRAADAFRRATLESRDRIARGGARLVQDGHRILTHCHSTTVVAILRQAWAEGRRFEVWATETRPFQQGILTVRDLAGAGIPATLVVDGAANRVLKGKPIDQVLVGADTVSREGHLFNKIGTSGVAALAGILDIPFRAAAGFHKFTDRPAADVVVEERPANEILGRRALPRGARAENPVFDRTDAEDVVAYVTEDGPRPPLAAVARALEVQKGVGR